MKEKKQPGRPLELVGAKNVLMTMDLYCQGVLATKRNKSAYIRRLIREDVERNKK
ncbi:MAG: hypothetical protein ACPGUE_11095 [Marinomonas sp.]